MPDTLQPFHKKDRARPQSRITRSFLGTGLATATGHALNFLMGILLARLLGVEGYGSYALTMAVIALLGLPTKAGLPTLIVRETATSTHTKDWGKLKGLLISTNRYVVSYAAIAFTCVWLTCGGQPYEVTEFRHQLFWALPLLLLVSFTNVRAATLRGLKLVAIGQIPEQIVRPLVLIALLILLAYNKQTATPIEAIQFNLIASFVAFAVGAAILWHYLPNEITEASPSYEWSRWTRSIVPLSLFIGLKQLDTQTSTILIGYLANTESVALYRIASNATQALSIGVLTLNGVIAPHIVTLSREGRLETLQKLLTKSTRLVTIVTLTPALTLVAFSETAITTLFGNAYADASTTLVILTTGVIINTATGSVATLLNMTGHDKTPLFALAIGLTLKLALGVLLIPALGAAGCAIAETVSISTWNILLVIYAKKKLKLNPSIL
jgi:O-antigen/teichoic acid export membrane protein